MRRVLFFIAMLLVCAVPMGASATPAAPSSAAVPIILGRAVAPLTGPWRFHIGDDPRWKTTAVDDSGWESVDLTPKPGAHDDDVGLTGYVPGWGARGHKGYAGYAWYRMRVEVQAPPGAALAMTGPPYVDGAYQLFVNGRLVGSAGGFSGATPRVYGRQPRLIHLTSADFTHGPALIAIRVYTPPALARPPSEAGGVHIAPALGEAQAVDAQYRVQWMQVFWGYVVDAAEALILAGLTMGALIVAAFDRKQAPAWRWLAVAILLLAARRANQNVMFWLQIETITAFEIITGVVLISAYYGAWAMAAWRWLGPGRPTWVPRAIAAATVAIAACQALGLVEAIAATPSLLAARGVMMETLRLVFLAFMLAAIVAGLRRDARAAILPVLALVSMGVGLFASELSFLHVPGIWFPWGVGVSRTQYAYAVFIVIFGVVLVERLLWFARGREPHEAGTRAI